ncbi:uncharacterized protein LOC135964248 [Calliphora vicina]|uniref:uncharacterized protein LOC135964248 n=1 Tax=Calliphora vicina TaxID=7373 RepID=UPI00325A863E
MSSSGASKKNYTEHSGEPGCATSGEVKKFFRHFWDPTSYWECEEQGKPAALKRCGASELYSDKHGKCVHYREWEWTEPTEPPSRPKTQ